MKKKKKKKNIKDVVEIDVHMGLLCMEEIIRCGCERQQIMEDILMLKRKCAWQRNGDTCKRNKTNATD